MSTYLPTIILDPFEKYRPFPENPKNLLEAHWHEILGSTIFYFLIQYLSKPISKLIFGSKYTTLKPSTKINFDVHITSMVQCFISILILVPHLNNPHFQNRNNDPINSLLGYTPFGTLICSLSVGYFIWDLVVCLKYYKLFGIGFLLHAIAALFAFGCGFIPYCQPWAGAFLSFELSTPFVNLNWFASHLPAGTFSDKFVIINGLLLIIVFFFVRIIWGIYAVIQMGIDMTYSLNQINILIPISILLMNTALNLLNIFWFYKMIKIAKKKASGKSSTKQSSKEIDKVD
ncbi:uncharacterized protein KGF55_000579 [Candida pseudojiufengensis]|uniref:uncharacterized protein n=1 Tax=Candida pseudojiufengensis TaxID=497109 RepID=UPI0022249699|nr:uncharacterized protein KGF55_000579 [Candida pseudojiufengensis]KAI5966270.1 hypothetical protein KGF55_000579 [Candida pseudojiufengensis]